MERGRPKIFKEGPKGGVLCKFGCSREFGDRSNSNNDRDQNVRNASNHGSYNCELNPNRRKRKRCVRKTRKTPSKSRKSENSTVMPSTEPTSDGRHTQESLIAPAVDTTHISRIIIPNDNRQEGGAKKRTSEELQENNFQSIEQIVELRFQTMLPTLERVAKEAPKEIMRRLVRSCETNSAFSGVVDSMIQCGIDKEREKMRAATGIMKPTLPTLPGQYEPGVYFYGIKKGIEMRFKNTGAWGALVEVREWPQQVLKSLDGDGMFRMYEPNTLMNFWRLLAWANELWKCILFEEENKELVERHKQMWVKELQGWTNLVLKCDWRDYFVIEFEVEVRKLTLNILESIVTAGYFEQTKDRYEILYRVLKDALSNDAFRDARNVQYILKIVTWSISDVMILKHLCYKTNEGSEFTN